MLSRSNRFRSPSPRRPGTPSMAPASSEPRAWLSHRLWGQVVLGQPLRDLSKLRPPGHPPRVVAPEALPGERQRGWVNAPHEATTARNYNCPLTGMENSWKLRPTFSTL